MRSCPDCGTVYSPSVDVCSRDGSTLVDAPGFRDGRALDAGLLDPGTVVAERFEVVRLIGEGGMGLVYEAVQRPLGRTVALKVLRETVSWNDDTVKRFHQEARAMSHLAHPNTVKVFDFGSTEEGHLYLAMELLEGASLTSALENRALGVPDALEIADQVLASLEEAHDKGIVHRDLKPDNIFLVSEVDGSTTVKVLDFGIAKVIHGDLEIDQLETQAGTVFGTPRYMSPEQAQGSPLDGRSDLYTVGVLLYQMTTGEPPFDSEDAVLVMARHIRELPPAPRARDPYAHISLQLDRVIMKALAKAPEDRYPDATAFREALAEAMPSVLRHERASGVTLGVDRAVRRSGRKAWWTAGALLAAAALLAVWWGLREPAVASSSAQAAAPVPRSGPEAPSSEADPTPTGLAAPTLITATLHSDPPGAEVLLNDTVIGVTPLQHALPAGSVADVLLRLPNHEDQPFRLAAVAPVQEVTLRRERRPRPTTRSGVMAAPAPTPMRRTRRQSRRYERFD